MSKVLPVLFFVISLVFVTFLTGLFIGEYKVGPYRFFANGAKTLVYSVKALTAPPYLGQFHEMKTGVAPSGAAAKRFSITPEGAAYPEKLLINGGLNEYRDLCPDDGCIGLEVDRTGAVLHAYPYRPDAIFAADSIKGSLYREAVPADPRLIQRPLGLQRYDNGDLLITFQSVGDMFPFAAGVARVDKDGQPVWFRFDYSHHWATLLPDGRALMPDLVITDGNWKVPVGPHGEIVELPCETGRPEVDGVQILGPDGQLERRIDVAAALLASPWSAALAETTDACDPLHINFVDVLDDSAPGGALSPGYFLISLRNISSLAVLDPATNKITAVVRGNFEQQHSVHHLSGSKVLMFDNWGGDAEVGRVSRLMEVDLATGAERRVFPQPDTPQAADRLFSDRGSYLTISPDKTRALVSYSGEGRGFEVDIATGRVILSYDSLHDLSALKNATALQKDQATRAALFGISYIPE